MLGMRDTFLDVTLAVSQRELDVADDPSALVLEKMRGEADRVCMEVGGRLRTDRNPEVVIRNAEHKLTGERYVLLATRWAVVVPDGVAAAHVG